MILYDEIHFCCLNLASKLKLLGSAETQKNYDYSLALTKPGELFTALTHIGNKKGLTIRIVIIEVEFGLRKERGGEYKIIFTVNPLRKCLTLFGLTLPAAALCVLFLNRNELPQQGNEHWLLLVAWLCLLFASAIYSVIDFAMQKKYYWAVISQLLNVRELNRGK